jgi:transketolase
MDVAIMRAMPNMTVLVPSDSVEARKIIPLVSEYEGPVYIRISRSEMPVIFDESHKIELGKGQVVREGNDVTLIANGHMLSRALEAADKLAAQGVKARVVNLPTVKPLDKDLIVKCAEETKAIVTCEEHTVIGGLGSAVAEVLVRECPIPVDMIGIADVFTETALDHDTLMDAYGMSVDEIVRSAQKVMLKQD